MTIEESLYPLFPFLSQTQLTEHFDADLMAVGRWLMDLGLKQRKGPPTDKALQQGLVELVGEKKVPRWKNPEVIEMLVAAGHPLKPAAQASPTSTGPEQTSIRQVAPPPSKTDAVAGRLNGPFTLAHDAVRGGDNWLIACGSGDVCISIRGYGNADFVLEILNLAHKHGKIGGQHG